MVFKDFAATWGKRATAELRRVAEEVRAMESRFRRKEHSWASGVFQKALLRAGAH